MFAGRAPRVQRDGTTVRNLINRFLSAKLQMVNSGEIVDRTWDDYKRSCSIVISVFGRTRLVDDLRSDDFEALRKTLSKTRGPVALGNEISRVRILFKYGFDSGLIEQPVRYGPTFKRPSKQVLRKARNSKGPRMFEPTDLRRLFENASPQLRAMIMLGVNCGFGNNDCGTVPQTALDLGNGWADYPRTKTGIMRRCPLWYETRIALKAAIAARPRPTTDDSNQYKIWNKLMFLTKYGKPWATGKKSNPISAEFRKLLDKLSLYRPGLGFYALRHTFETIGGESRDQVAVDFIMGHAPQDNDMSSRYRERISDERLQSVTDYVRRWLFCAAADEV